MEAALQPRLRRARGPNAAPQNAGAQNGANTAPGGSQDAQDAGGRHHLPAEALEKHGNAAPADAPHGATRAYAQHGHAGGKQTGSQQDGQNLTESMAHVYVYASEPAPARERVSTLQEEGTRLAEPHVLDQLLLAIRQ